MPRSAARSPFAARARGFGCRSTRSILRPRPRSCASIPSTTVRSTQISSRSSSSVASTRSKSSRTGGCRCGSRTSAPTAGASGRAARTVSVVADVLDSDARCVVVDLGSLPTREEQALASTAILDALWRERERRQPVLVVVDEAHNVLPAEPADALTSPLDGGRDPHRRRGAQVRDLPPRLHAAAAEGARERAQPVRQPAAHADELAGRPRLRGRRLLVRPAAACSSARPCSGRASASSEGRSRRIRRS